MSDKTKRIAKKIIEQENCDGISCAGDHGQFKGTACPFLPIEDGEHCYDHAKENAEAYLLKDVMHWYCFTYSGKSIDGGHHCQACTYVGYDHQVVTKPMIDQNKKEAGVDNSAVLIGCIYLGKMTKADFLGS